MTRSEILQIAKPILFNTDMVRAIQDERKTVTRRVIKDTTCIIRPDQEISKNLKGKFELYNVTPRCGIPQGIIFKPPYQVGDYLYVRETYKRNMDGYSGIDFGGYIYKADCPSNFKDLYNPWHPSIHMPKEAARIFLRVTDVRAERLQEITDEQAEKEGAIDTRGFIHSPGNEYDNIHTAREHFKQIWNSTIPKKGLDKHGWDANPWVWVIEFERVEVEV